MALFTNEKLSPKQIKAKQHPWATTIKGIYSHRIKHAHNSIRNPKYLGKEEKQPDSEKVQFMVIGDRVTKAFTYCRNMVIGLHKYKWKNFDAPVIRGCSSIEWPDIKHDLKVRFPGEIANCVLSSVAVFVNGKILGGENELQQLVDSKYYYYLCLDYCNEGVAEFARFIRSSGRPFAYMHVSIDETHIGTLIFMLYADIVPYTCENFLRLCKETKGGYGGTPVHRIVKDGWIQCGGFGLKSTPLSCENFLIPFDKRGVLAMANDGRDNDCSTQFFVLLQPAPWMNQKYVAFGQLIEGAATLKKIERVTTWYESPTSKIILYRCGILNMECQDIMINKGVNQYIDGHIEDLNVFRKLLWECILETVFLKAQLREIERLREQYGEGAEGRPEESVTKFEKSGDDFALEETEYKVIEEVDVFKPLSISSSSLVEEPQTPYYIPLTDVPDPGDVESDFDLKRFLKGDYCLECDLDVNAYENAKTTKGIDQSLLFCWSDSESTTPPTSDEISLNSAEQKELNEYLKNNVDRVSFAGGVVKNIAKCSSKSTDIFSAEKHRPSTLITDEKLRKLKLATADLLYRERRNTKVSIAVPGAYDTEIHKQIKRRQTGFVTDEDLERIRVFSRQHFGGGFGDDDSDNHDDSDSDDDDDDYWSNKHTVHMDPGVVDTSQRRFQRRPTAYIPSTSRPPNDDSEDDDDGMIVNPFDKISHKDDDDEEAVHFDTQGFKQTAPSEALRRRRPTAFIRPEARPDDDDDDDDDEDEDDNNDDVKKPTPPPVFTPKIIEHKSHFATELPAETEPSEALMHRRPTTFVRPGAFPVDDDDDEDDKDDDVKEPAPLPSFTPKKHDQKFQFTTELPEESKTSEPFAGEPKTKPLQKSGAKFADEDDKPTPAETSHSAALMKRRATAYVRASDIRESDDATEQHTRESVLTRLYEAVDNDETGPTLKNYKPTAEIHLPKLILTRTSLLVHTSEESRLSREKYQHHLTLPESFDQLANIQYSTKRERKLSSDYVKTIDKFETRFAHSIRTIEYAKKRPTITVSQYQLMNRQYQEALERKATPP